MRTLAIAAVCVLLATSGRGQSTDRQDEITELKQEIAALMERVHKLEQRVQSTPAAAKALPETSEQASRPADISGYIASRYMRDPRSGELGTYQAHTASLFIGKTVGRWRLHTELEFDHLPEVNVRSLPISRPTGEVELEVGWLNYEHREWLNARAGLILIPTYWRLHNYPSTTLTVQPPLLYEQIFPPNIAGMMIHGSRYSEYGGFTYSLYAGQAREFLGHDNSSRRAKGGSFRWHVPTNGFMDVLDVGVHLYGDALEKGRRTVYGFESHVEKQRFEFLSEFAHSGVSSPGSAPERRLQGYYFQPSLRLGRGLFGVYRYDRMTFGDGSTDAVRHTLGFTYRPLPVIALKAEYDRYRKDGNGFGAGMAFFLK